MTHGTETTTMQDNNPIPLSEDVQQPDNIQTPSEDDQQQDSNQNERNPTDKKQVIDCVEAIITTKNKNKQTTRKKRPKKDSKTESSITRRGARVTY